MWIVAEMRLQGSRACGIMKLSHVDPILRPFAPRQPCLQRQGGADPDSESGRIGHRLKLTT